MESISPNSAPQDGSSHEASADFPHEPPRGAFLITVLYLVLLAVLWAVVYLDLLAQGGLPAQ